MSAISTPVHRQIALLATLLALLASCAPVTPPAMVTPTTVPATQTSTITPTSLPPSPTPTGTPLPLVAMEGLRFAYIIDGDIYVQESGGLPVQLTDSGQDKNPIFTDDGQKIIFFRGRLYPDMYSIDVNGGQERKLISTDILIGLNLGYGGSSQIHHWTLIPNTHQVLFSTFEQDPNELEKPSYVTKQYTDDLLLADADSGKIRQILRPGQGGNFFVSPKGDMIAIQTSGHVSVYGINGGLIRRNLINYIPSTPMEIYPDIFWIPDAKWLVALIPNETDYQLQVRPTFSVWRYFVNSGTAVKIKMDAPTLSNYYRISPDRNWILFMYSPQDSDDTKKISAGLYLSDLRSGGTRLIKPAWMDFFEWSPDSVYYMFRLPDDPTITICTMDENCRSLGDSGFLGWLDNNRLLYIKDRHQILLGKIGEEAKMIIADLSQNHMFSFTEITYNFTGSEENK